MLDECQISEKPPSAAFSLQIPLVKETALIPQAEPSQQEAAITRTAAQMMVRAPTPIKLEHALPVLLAA